MFKVSKLVIVSLNHYFVLASVFFYLNCLLILVRAYQILVCDRIT